MIEVIYKYQIQLKQYQILKGVPSGAKILKAGEDPTGNLCLWIQHPYATPTDDIQIEIYGTGHDIDSFMKKEHIDSVVMGRHVWHIFKRL